MAQGAFIVSLDFELYWGMRDRRSLAEYGSNIRGVRTALPRMLAAFDAHGVKATFSTVGLLFFRDKASMEAGLPELRPSYTNRGLSPYNGHFAWVGADEDTDPHHFGASLIDMIKRHPGHEIGCHTFSHYYCLERGQTVEQFTADLRASKRAAEAFGIELRSLVFPRNQYNEDYLEACAGEGITSYRGNERSWLYAARNREQERLSRRALRLLDTWFDLSGPNTHPMPVPVAGLPVDIPSSRFLRPCSERWHLLEGLRLRRITRAMDHAARTGEVFHLWWHPHNFGRDIDRNIAFLERILGHYASLRTRHGFRSLTMTGLAEEVHRTHA